jgi:hypothetical protein
MGQASNKLRKDAFVSTPAEPARCNDKGDKKTVVF